MSEPDDDGIRPGEPPPSKPESHVDGSVPHVPSISLPQYLLDIDRAFRAQTLSLGAAWIFVGLCAMAASGCLMARADELPARLRSYYAVLVMVSAGAALVWIPLGVGACLRRMWAIQAGLGVNYVLLLVYVAMQAASMLTLEGAQLFGALLAPSCGALIILISILQAHRVIWLDQQLRAARLR